MTPSCWRTGDVTMKQAKAYLEALIKGDPDALAVVKESAKQMWAKVRA